MQNAEERSVPLMMLQMMRVLQCKAFNYKIFKLITTKNLILNVGYIIDGEHLTKEELTKLVSPSSTTKSVKDTLRRNERSARESKMGQQSVPLSKIEELNQVNIVG